MFENQKISFYNKNMGDMEQTSQYDNPNNENKILCILNTNM